LNIPENFAFLHCFGKVHAVPYAQKCPRFYHNFMYIYRICFAFLFFMPYWLIGQSLNDLEITARAATGNDRVEKLVLVSDAAMAQGEYERAFDLAEEATAFAKKINQSYLRAKGLNREGKALMFLSKRKRLFGKEKPSSRFSQSNEILKKAGMINDPLLLDNMEQMKGWAQKNGQTDEIAKIESEITRIKNGVTGAPPESRQELRQELNALITEIGRNRMAKDTTQAFAARLMEQSQQLQLQLEEKEAAINQMSEGQMKVEMMLMQQRQMLDSLLYRSRVDSLLLTNQNLALGEAKASRNFSFAIAAVLLLLTGGILYGLLRARQNTRIMAEKNAIIESERQRSDKLLLNILPESVANELKSKGSTSARFFDDVTVLFADFVNFTQIAERITPQQLVSDLDTCFREFDRIMEKHGLEKIKTIGDAYLCAGGLSDKPGNQIFQMVNAARDMQQWLTEWNAARMGKGLPPYRARIGIHSGAVVAGVVGARKFAFDIWGDTVNIAARIEQAGEAGRINLSGSAFLALNNQVACNFRGKIPVKNKGEIDMFFVD
jgi:class 3 adenylate cyclase